MSQPTSNPTAEQVIDTHSTNTTGVTTTTLTPSTTSPSIPPSVPFSYTTRLIARSYPQSVSFAPGLEPGVYGSNSFQPPQPTCIVDWVQAPGGKRRGRTRDRESVQLADTQAAAVEVGDSRGRFGIRGEGN